MKTQTPAARLPARLAPRFFRFGLAGLGLAALLLVSAPAQAATAPDLASTEPYAIVSATLTNTTAGTTIDGDVCYTTEPAVAPAITGATVVPCPDVTGTDQNDARADLVSQDCTPIGAAVALNDISIGGGTPGEFPPGCYSSTGAMSITADTSITLSGTGIYVFRPGGAITTGANSSVVIADGACADDVFWAPEGATTIGANADFIGNIFRGTADGLSITFGDSSSLIGRALAFGSTVTTANTTVGVPEACAELATITVNKDFIPDSTGTVSVALSCTSGTATTTPLDASEAQPAVFTVSGAEVGATCTATETVPDGYTADQTNCETVSLDSSCTITNTVNSDSIVVYKDFTPDSDAPVSVSLTCTTGTATVTPLDAAEGAPAVFTISGAEEGATCTATETVPEGYIANEAGCVDVPLGGSCEITNLADNPADRVTFRVSKDFTDGNPMNVMVTLTCNAGLPLVQSFEINENSIVEFVVTSFGASAPDCAVTEVLTPGYSPTYTAGTTTGLGLVTDDLEGCYFDDVVSGQFLCLITNTPDLVDIEIEKLWVFDATGGAGVDTRYTLRLSCDEPIGLVDVFEGDDSDTFLAQVAPLYPSTHCWVEETVYASEVEVDNECGDLVISAAEGGDSCLITNSVFFEGIPALGQIGTALLAALLLGVGMVGFRRFA